MGVNSLPKTVARQRRDCDLNPGPPSPESSTLTTRLPSHPISTLLRPNASLQGVSLSRGQIETRGSFGLLITT